MAKILVVDDVKFIARMIATIFEQNGHDTEIATGGRQAVEMARTVMPDLILLDIAMPEIDGLEVARILKSESATHHIPIMMVSSRNDMRTIASAYAADVSEYVVKPFEAEELLEKAALLLDGPRQDYSIDEVDHVPLVTILHDEIALGTLDQIPQALETARGSDPKPIVLDLSRVRRIDGDVSAIVAEFERKIRELGEDLTVVGPEAGLGASSIFPGIKEALKIYDNRDAALAAARAGNEPTEPKPLVTDEPAPHPAPSQDADVTFEEHDHMVIARIVRPDLGGGVVDRVGCELPKSAFILLVDLKEVAAVTSAEARSLAWLGETMSLSGRGFKIVNPNPRVAEILRQAGLGSILFWMREKRTRATRRADDARRRS